MKVSLIISTYNWKEALRLSLKSVKAQTVIPYEVIVADDGSNTDTKELISELKKDFPCKLIHVWHEDLGWRKCVIMNRAFAICKGDYIIEIDGDIILEKHFIEDHITEAKPNYFLTGSRGKLTKKLSEHFIHNKNYKIHTLQPGVKRIFNVLRIPLLSKLFYHYKLNKKERGCNISFWKKDIMSVNGYDENFVGYGYEDIDLPNRLRRLGVKKRFLKFKAIEYHLYHKESNSKKNMEKNKIFYDNNNKHGIVRCKSGINNHLLDNNIVSNNEL